MIIPSFKEERLLAPYIYEVFYIVFLHIWSAKQSYEVGGTNMALIFLSRKRASSIERNFHNNQTFIVCSSARECWCYHSVFTVILFLLNARLKWPWGAFLPHSLSNSILNWPIIPLLLALLHIQLDFYVSTLTTIWNISWTGVILQLMCDII